MLKRAIASFRAQTYTNKRLVIFNTGPIVGVHDLPLVAEVGWADSARKWSIGELRNEANSIIAGDVICHFDDDDLSHRSRIAEQVALLQASGAECVGYNEAVFWDTRKFVGSRDRSRHPAKQFAETDGDPHANQGESVEGYVNQAYIYRNYSPDYCIGSSMMYTRAAWERVKFDHINSGEDGRFLQRVRSVGVSSLREVACSIPAIDVTQGGMLGTQEPDRYRRFIPGIPEFGPGAMLPEPRMICSIHGGNTSHYNPEGERNSYRRAPEWVAHCERIMKL